MPKHPNWFTPEEAFGNPKTERLRDPAYRKSAQGRQCDVPGCHDTETVVLAHISIAGNSGMGIKPPDDESLFLCAKHHDEFDGRRDYEDARTRDGHRWIVRNIVIPQRRAAYRKWIAER